MLENIIGVKIYGFFLCFFSLCFYADDLEKCKIKAFSVVVSDLDPYLIYVSEKERLAEDGERCRHGILSFACWSDRQNQCVNSGSDVHLCNLRPPKYANQGLAWSWRLTWMCEDRDWGRRRCFMAPGPHGLQRDACIAGHLLFAGSVRFSVTSARFATCWHKRSGICVWT